MKDPLLVIYPTTLKVRDQLVRLSRAGVLLGHRLTTLPRLVESLWRESDDRRAPLDSMGERLALREAVARSHTGRPSRQGSLDRYISLIQRLKAGSISVGEWRAAVDNLPAAERAGLADFTETFAAYENFLRERHLADRHDREAATLAMLHRCETSGEKLHFLEGVERLLIAEIYDLSLLQFMIVAALIRLVGDAELTIQAEPHKVGVSRFAELTWNRFVGEESIADKVLPEFVRREGRGGRLGFLLEQIFTGTFPEAPPPDESVKIVEAANPCAEAEQTARMIRRMIESNPALALERVGIIARDFDAYAGYLESAFRRYHLPLAIETMKPLRTSIPARTVLDLLRIPLNDYRCDALTALCDAPLIDARLADFRSLPVEVGYIDRTTRPLAECCEKRRRELPESLDDGQGTGEHPVTAANKPDYLTVGTKAWGDLLQAFQALETTATVQEHLENARNLLERLHFDPLRGSLVDAAAKGGAAWWRMLDELSAGAAQIIPERKISLGEFLQILELGLTCTEAKTESSAGGGVRGLSVMDARGLDFDVVFILGLSDGEFPRYYPDDPLIPDRTLRELNRALRDQVRRRLGAKTPDAPGPLLRSSRDRNSEEPFLFFLGLSMPARAVVLSRPVEDESGKPLARSPFLAEVIRLLDTDSDPQQPALDPARWHEAFTTRDFLIGAACDDLGGNAIIAAGIAEQRAASIARRTAIQRARESYFAMATREELFDRRKRLAENKGRWLATSRALDADEEKYTRAGIYDGHVGGRPALRRFLLEGSEGARVWSATQLTELASCGFRFFARRVMRLDEDDEPDYEPTKSEAGNWAHQILHDLVEAQPDFHDLATVRAVAQEIIALKEAYERARARDLSFFDAHWNSVVKVVDEAMLYEFARQQADSRPVEFKLEHPLSFYLERKSEADEALRIRLEGRIDRLEIYRDTENRIAKLRVIDYKDSKSRARLGELLKPQTFAVADLQMAVYLLGAMAELREQFSSQVTAEASYIALKDRAKETSPCQVPLEMLENRDAPDDSASGVVRMKDRVLGLVKQALAGRFDIDPLECKEWCPYRRICRFDKSLG